MSLSGKIEFSEMINKHDFDKNSIYRNYGNLKLMEQGLKLFANLVSNKKQVVLDAGCGKGEYLPFLLDFGYSVGGWT